MKRMSAFSLLELLVVMAIISIAAALAFPSFSQLVEKHRSQQAAYGLQHVMQFARAQALAKGKTLTVCAGNEQQQCINSADWSNKTLLIFIDSNTNGNLDAGEELLRIFDLKSYQGRLLWRSFGNKTYLQWQSNGMTYYQNGSFLFCPHNGNTKNAFLLILNAAGRLYFASDKNGDGIVEDSSGNNVQC